MNLLTLFLSSQMAATSPTVSPAPGKLLQSGSESVETVTNNEVIYVRTNTVSDSVGNQFHVSFNEAFQPISFNALTPSISTIDDAGNTTYVTNGTAQFQIVAENIATGQTRGFIVSQPVSMQGATVTNLTLSRFASGSVSETISNSVAAKLTGSFSTNRVEVFSTRSYPTNFVRNTNFWINGVTGLSSVALCKGTSVTAISPLHAYAAWHYCPAVGATVRFVDTNNVTVSRTIVSRQQVIAPGQYGGGDVAIVLLDSALPSSVEFAKVIASFDQMPSVKSEVWSDNQRFKGRSLPAVVFNQFDRAYVRELVSVTNSFSANYATDWFPGWTVNIIGGDSGKPVFLLIDNELALIGGWTFAGSGYPIGLQESDVNTAMAALSNAAGATVYTLTEYDLSSFNSY